MQKVITIPKELAKKHDLVLIPLQEYEEYLQLKKIIPLVRPSASEKKAIRQGRKEIRQGKYVSLKELKDELES